MCSSYLCVLNSLIHMHFQHHNKQKLRTYSYDHLVNVNWIEMRSALLLLCDFYTSREADCRRLLRVLAEEIYIYMFDTEAFSLLTKIYTNN